MLEVGNLDEGELVEETFNFGDHKILGIPGIHFLRKDPGGYISSHVFQIIYIILNIVCFHCFGKIDWTTAAVQQQRKQKQKGEMNFMRHVISCKFYPKIEKYLLLYV